MAWVISDDRRLVNLSVSSEIFTSDRDKRPSVRIIPPGGGGIGEILWEYDTLFQAESGLVTIYNWLHTGAIGVLVKDLG